MDTNTATETTATTANVDATATQAAATEVTTDATTAAAGGTEGATTETTEATDTAQADEAAAEATGAPESYADFTVPEGTAIDPPLLDEFKAYAKANNLPQDRAQEAVNLGAKVVQQTIKQFQDAHVAQVKQWAEQTKADPLVGGAAYEANVALALKAVADFGDPDLKAVFDTYGLGNNPALVRFAYRIGKAMSESGGVHGAGNEQPAANPKSLRGALWGDDPLSNNVKTS